MNGSASAQILAGAILGLVIGLIIGEILQTVFFPEFFLGLLKQIALALPQEPTTTGNAATAENIIRYGRYAIDLIFGGIGALGGIALLSRGGE